jgi:hypothetical protein
VSRPLCLIRRSGDYLVVSSDLSPHHRVAAACAVASTGIVQPGSSGSDRNPPSHCNQRPPPTSVLTVGDRRAAPPPYIHLPLPCPPRPPTSPGKSNSGSSSSSLCRRRGDPGWPARLPVPVPRARLARDFASLTRPPGAGGGGAGAMGIGAVSDELLGTFVPIAVYWLYSGLYVALDGVGRLDGYRLHTREEAATKNVVSRAAVVRGVLLQQVFQVAVSLTLFAVVSSSSSAPAVPLSVPRNSRIVFVVGH